MSYTFETELFGLSVEVTGYFEEGEDPSVDCPGCDPAFHIEEIEHNSECFEIDSLPAVELNRIDKEAFESVINEHD